MALEVKQAKVNPSRSYPTTAATLPARPLALVSEFAEGRRVRARGKLNLSSGRRKSSTPRSSSRSAPTLRNVTRTIVP